MHKYGDFIRRQQQANSCSYSLQLSWLPWPFHLPILTCFLENIQYIVKAVINKGVFCWYFVSFLVIGWFLWQVLTIQSTAQSVHCVPCWVDRRERLVTNLPWLMLNCFLPTCLLIYAYFCNNWNPWVRKLLKCSKHGLLERERVK